MSKLEAAFAAIENEATTAQKAADGLTKSLRRLRAAAKTGQVGEIEKQVAAAAQRATEAAEAARRLPGAWQFDETYLAQGYSEELRQAADEAGVRLIERDGRLYCFPLLLRIEPRFYIKSLRS